YYRADVETLPGGAVRPRSRPENIEAVMDAVIAADWSAILARVAQPALLLHAAGGYGPPGAPPVLDPESARATAARLPGCRIRAVPGNHMTMLYADGAQAIVGNIAEFLAPLGRNPDVHR
ncbi:MAG TPA: hypothetical protein VD886_11495, partial [Herpetosiphonaceae bacterium]|nr:hypothetical protein [Herpetosiphonaceae bacterium]